MRSVPPLQLPCLCRLSTDIKPSTAPAGSGCPMRRGHAPTFDSFPTGSAGLLESYQSTEGVPSTVAESHFSPVEGLLPCCGPESTVINQLPVLVCVGGGAGRHWTDRHLRRSQVLPSSLEEADGVSWALDDPTGPTFVISCNDKEFAPLAPPFIPPPSSERPWQGMLGPAGHAGNAISHSYGWKKTTLSVMGGVRGGMGGGLAPALIKCWMGV